MQGSLTCTTVIIADGNYSSSPGELAALPVAHNLNCIFDWFCRDPLALWPDALAASTLTCPISFFFPFDSLNTSTVNASPKTWPLKRLQQRRHKRLGCEAFAVEVKQPQVLGWTVSLWHQLKGFAGLE